VIGTQRLAFELWGDTVNVASRLQAATEPGTVAVSAATLHGLDGAQVSGLGALSLRGKREPVEAYVLEALR